MSAVVTNGYLLRCDKSSEEDPDKLQLCGALGGRLQREGCWGCWQGWRRFKASATCESGVWTDKVWDEIGDPGDDTQQTFPSGGNHWGWVYVPACHRSYETPGTVTGGNTVDCDGEGSLAYKVDSEIVVWGPVRPAETAKTEANIGIDTPTNTTIPITGELWYRVAQWKREGLRIGSEPGWNHSKTDTGWFTGFFPPGVGGDFSEWDCIVPDLCYIRSRPNIYPTSDIKGVCDSYYEPAFWDSPDFYPADSIWESNGVAILGPFCSQGDMPVLAGGEEDPEEVPPAPYLEYEMPDEFPTPPCCEPPNPPPYPPPPPDPEGYDCLTTSDWEFLDDCEEE